MAPAHCRHGCRVVVSPRSRYRRNSRRESTLISACATDEPKTSPCGPARAPPPWRGPDIKPPPRGGGGGAGPAPDVPAAPPLPALPERLPPRLINSVPGLISSAHRTILAAARAVGPPEKTPRLARGLVILPLPWHHE